VSTTESIGTTHVKICKRCFREFKESEVDVVDVSLVMELTDCLDSRFRGNDKEDRGNDRGGYENNRWKTDIGVEDINDLCPQCREELGVMDLLGFGLWGRADCHGVRLRWAFQNDQGCSG